jgi:feruloyl-CoA synthase
MSSIATRSLDEIEAAPLRKVRFWEPEIATEERADGTVLVRQRGALGRFPDKLTDRLVYHATATPDRTYLAERDPSGEWRTLSYAETLDRVRRIGTALLGYGLSEERPIAILSGNDIEHALIGLAAQYVGIPYAPISPAYSLVSSDFSKLKEIVGALTPGLVFVADGAQFESAIAAAVPASVPVVTTRRPIEGRGNATFADLVATEPGAAVDEVHARVGADTIAKILFTSGSTGSPKGVINTQRMLCSNQEMVRDCYAFLEDEPPVVLDWAPWNHTAGGNKVFNMVLYNGGTFYIDDGRPTPDLIRKTARNLHDVAPTWYFNVPKGYEELIPHLDADAALRRRFFSRLNLMMYAGAGLAQHTWSALESLAVKATGERVILATGLGSTETAPFSLMCTTDQRIAGNIGLPARGLTLKLVPSEEKLEARLKGPNITPGYWRDPELTAEAFDEEGFYRLGDAFRFADRDDPSKGFYFDGRLAENFKLRTGTWVSVGALRARFIDHFGEIVRDVVITGLDREHVGALVFPDIVMCRKLAKGLPDDASAADVLADPRVRSVFAEKLKSLGRKSTGSSTHVSRLLLMAEPPSIDRGEITDKGSINQRAVLRHRADRVEELYEGTRDVIVLDGSGH